MPKYKLAEFRYGREEMLALYIREHKVGPPLHGAQAGGSHGDPVAALYSTGA